MNDRSIDRTYGSLKVVRTKHMSCANGKWIDAKHIYVYLKRLIM